MAAINPRAPQWMTEASGSQGPDLNDGEMDADRVAFSTQLYYALVMTCRGQALNRIVNAGPGEGLEAWRLLMKHHEPPTTTRHAGMLMEILAFSFEGDPTERIQRFERDVFRYEESSGEKVTENVRIGVVLRNMPKGPLQEHLIMNADRLKTWAAITGEIENIARAKATTQSAGSASAPDIDSLSNKKLVQLMNARIESMKAGGKGSSSGSKGKGQGKGQGAGVNSCSICGRTGHTKRDCWWAAAQKGQKGDGKNKGTHKELEKATTKEKDKTARGRVRPRNAGNVAKRDT